MFPVGRVKDTRGSLMDCYLPYFHLCLRKTSWKHSGEFLPEKGTLFFPVHLDFGLLMAKGGRLCTRALFALCWLAKGDKIKAPWLGRQESAFGSIGVCFWRRGSVKVGAGGSGKLRGVLPFPPSLLAALLVPPQPGPRRACLSAVGWREECEGEV